jgi:hypothetical protein
VASGTLRAEDYRDVVLPALERAAAEGEIRFVVVISGRRSATDARRTAHRPAIATLATRRWDSPSLPDH